MKNVRNVITLVCLLVLSILTVGLFFGCGQSGTTSSTAATTSTLTAGASVGQVAQNVASIATNVIGISNAANLATSLSGITGSKLKAKTAPPPASFFSNLSADGWLNVPSTGPTVEVRFYTKGGQLINDTYLATKKIATIEGFDWKSLTTISSTADALVVLFNLTTKVKPWLLGTNLPPAWNIDATSQAAFYASLNKYRSCLSLFDYMLWAYFSPSVEGKLIKGFYESTSPTTLFTAYPNIATPEADANDKMGTNEVRVNGSNAGGGTIVVTMSTSFDATGNPVSIIGSGSSTLTDGTVMTITLNVNLTDIGPTQSSSITIVASSPTNMSIILNPTYSAGVYTGWSGTVKDTSSAQIGGVVIFAAPDAQGHNGYYYSGLTDVAANRQYF